MHTIARASSFNSLPAGPGAFSYPSYHHHSSISGSASQSRSEPPTPSEPSLSTGPGAAPYFGAAPAVVGPQQTPARGCLKPPSKEFATKSDAPEPEIQIAPSSSVRNAAGSARRRPNMKLERLPSNAIARIQLAEGVEPHVAAEQGKNATTSGAKAKCKQRVPTPYVKSDKSSWLSDGEE